MLSAPCPDPATALPYDLARDCHPRAAALSPEGRILPSGREPDGKRANQRSSVGFPLLRLQESTNPCASAFDILQVDGRELLDEPLWRRREVLEALFADHRLTPPWTLCPSTTDLAVAQEWPAEWTDVPGVEGVVVKSRAGRYRPGIRGSWYKVRRRATTEAIIGGITGSLPRPQVLLLGRFDMSGRLRLVGKTVPLKPAAANEVAGQLTAADTDHPWTGVRFSARWGSRERLDPVLVEPRRIAEIRGDTAQDAGVLRHPVRYVRLRQDMTATDVPTFEGIQPHTG
ncbi:ATP-dependent DNA ligase [Streptomyces atroolivaceus]|uniref:ATP-dependent DNA ligase n=1 Tax=Streptomyces atroolivaceus TaxID=66869 RepID=UPI00362C8C23